jgi:hypothetical protein
MRTCSRTTGKLNALADRRGRHHSARQKRLSRGLGPSNKKLINQQKTIFKNLTTLRSPSMFEVGYTDVPRPDNLDNLGGTWDTGSADVTELVQLRKVDKQATEASYTWELTVRGGRLLITDVKPTEERQLRPDARDGSVLTVVRSRHMIVQPRPTRRIGRGSRRRGRSRVLALLPYWRKGVRASSSSSPPRRGPPSGGGTATTTKSGEDEAIAKAIEVPSCCSNRRRVLGDVTSLRNTVTRASIRIESTSSDTRA